MTHNMFLYRLKAELPENIRLLIPYWLCLTIVFVANLFWWFDSGISGNDGPAYTNSFVELASWLVVLGVGGVAFILISTMFKRDDLKDPQDFCATRPIRPLSLYGAKLAFIWLAIVLPASLAMTIMGLVAECGFDAIIGGLQALLWVGFGCTLLAFSCMSHAGGSRSLIMLGAFIIGVVVTSWLIFFPGHKAPWADHTNRRDEIAMNFLIILPVLTAASIWLCIRQARHKHLNHRPLWLTLTGAISMLCIVFIPLSNSLRSEPTQLSVVTQVSLNADNIAVGEKGGTHYLEGQILSQPIEQLDSRSLCYNYDVIPVKTIGVDAPWFEVHYTGFNEYYGPRFGPKPTELRFTYTVYATEPGAITSNSSSTNSRFSDALSKLPKCKIRIKDTIAVDYWEYEEFHRSSLVEGFSLNTNGLKISHVPASSDASSREDRIISKQFSVGLMGSADIFRDDVFRYFIAHPSLDQPIELNDFNEGATGNSALFGRSMIRDYDLSENGIRSSYMWQELTMEQRYQGTPAEWKQEAILITEKAGEKKTALIPLDIEIEIPDPELIRKMLIEGEL